MKIVPMLAGLAVGSIAPVQSAEPGETFRDCATCPEMVIVPAGGMVMGSSAEEGEREGVRDVNQVQEKPQHTVTIAKPFAVGRTEVSKGDYAAFVNATGHESAADCTIWKDATGSWELTEGKSWRDPGFAQSDAEPVVCVDWHDAVAYVDWISEQAGKPYRLLSEAEWEYAARAGSAATRPWGNERETACANANVSDRSRSDAFASVEDAETRVFPCADGHVYTAAVGSFPANAYGLHDMIGNVWEWLADCAVETYDGTPADGSAWMDGDCARRAYRGGSWYDPPRNLRVARRVWAGVDDGVSLRGLRVARDLE